MVQFCKLETQRVGTSMAIPDVIAAVFLMVKGHVAADDKALVPGGLIAPWVAVFMDLVAVILQLVGAGKGLVAIRAFELVRQVTLPMAAHFTGAAECSVAARPGAMDAVVVSSKRWYNSSWDCNGIDHCAQLSPGRVRHLMAEPGNPDVISSSGSAHLSFIDSRYQLSIQWVCRELEGRLVNG